MLRVLVDISGHMQAPAGSQSRREKIESVRPDYAAMLVLILRWNGRRVFIGTALRPRVREEDADLVETRFWFYMRLQEGDGVNTTNFDVFGVRLGQAY